MMPTTEQRVVALDFAYPDWRDASVTDVLTWLADELIDAELIEREVAVAYDNLTGGRMTKANTASAHVIAAHDEHCHLRPDVEGIEPLIQRLDRFLNAYPEDVFPVPPSELRARDAAAADVLRRVAYPMVRDALHALLAIAGDAAELPY